MKKSFVFAATILVGIVLNSQESDASNVTTPKGPGSYEMVNKSSASIAIPFKMHNGKPLMDVEINDAKAALMIDNGVLWDQVWLFGSPLVEKLQLSPIGESGIEGAGEGDPTMAYTSSNLTLKFQGISFFEQPVLVSPPAAGFSKMFPGTDGQLCNTFFRHFIVEFDFIQNEIILHKPAQFEYKGTGSILDMHVTESGTYSVPFTFKMQDGKTFNHRVDIDFGGIYAFKIALNNKHDIQLPKEAKSTFSYGAQGRAVEYSGKISSMKIGNYSFENPTVVFGDEKTSRIHPDNLGVIGLPIFMQFNIIFDYFNNKLYLEPNANYSTAIE
ncbi:hypothetical protein HQ531_09120 [bacterium]|nr:hypothetical protein [bacterium]